MRNLKQLVIFSLLILFICYDESMAADSPCGDWESYKDEKCFKIIDETLRTYANAEISCSQLENTSTLPIIRSKDEQDFLSNFLFKTQKKVDNVWIGAKFTSNKFKWTDDTDLSFTNWGEGSPRNKTNYCVQMQLDEASVGKWIDEPCEKKDLVVCQKMQTWSLSRLQKTLLDARKKFEDSLEDIRKNPVPIGFIYVQLPNEKSPTEIWPWMTWNDVSSAYAGVFFRVTGGEAASFGNVQEDNAPRLINVYSYACTISCPDENGNPYILPISKGVKSDWTKSQPLNNIAFEMSSGEVRPRNMAIRIWKRTG